MWDGNFFLCCLYNAFLYFNGQLPLLLFINIYESIKIKTLLGTALILHGKVSFDLQVFIWHFILLKSLWDFHCEKMLDQLHRDTLKSILHNVIMTACKAKQNTSEKALLHRILKSRQSWTKMQTKWKHHNTFFHTSRDS